MYSTMKYLLYLSLSLLLLSSCINDNTGNDYTAVLEIKKMALSRSPWDSTYVFFIDGYIHNYSKDSIWVIPFEKGWEGVFEFLPSYIVGSIKGNNIEFNKIGAIGKLNSGECFRIHLYKRIEEKELPSKYLIDHIHELKFSYVPVKDSTIFIKRCIDLYKYTKNWMKKYPDTKDIIPDSNAFLDDYKPYKDSTEMHFVNKMKFLPIPKNMRIELLQDGRDASSLFL